MSGRGVRAVNKALPAVLLFAVTGCTLQHQYSPEPLPEHGPVIFVADGAGDFRAASAAFRKALAEEHEPVHIETVTWSHGYLRILRDQLDYAHGRVEGYRLAARIEAFRQSHPEVRIYLAGHSAGTVVAVAAAEALPPGSIEGMVLLAPSLSTFYDLRPALHAVRKHLDVYYSCRDWGYLGVGTAIFGTSDRLRAPASGRIGFQVYADTPEDRAELQKLRQHAWRMADWRTGNNGGHYGSYQPGFLGALVLPGLFEPEMH
jgi:pimeloyl-ACP methyl ester carboxylesterase